jgi:hypothetical protein
MEGAAPVRPHRQRCYDMPFLADSHRRVPTLLSDRAECLWDEARGIGARPRVMITHGRLGDAAPTLEEALANQGASLDRPAPGSSRPRARGRPPSPRG